MDTKQRFHDIFYTATHREGGRGEGGGAGKGACGGEGGEGWARVPLYCVHIQIGYYKWLK